MKVFYRYILPFLSGILLFAAWPMSPLPFLIFIAFIPLLYLEEKTAGHRRFFLLAYVNFLIWNVTTTWWVWNASPSGSVAAFAYSSLLMSLPWMLFRLTKRQFGNGIGYVSLIVYWLTFEYIYLNVDLSWPWLTLGNVFANAPAMIQWYRFTGATGGSLWVLLINIFLFTSFQGYQFTEPFKVQSLRFKVAKLHRAALLTTIVVLVIPILISFWISSQHDVKPAVSKAENNIVVVQPNIDPYNEKFSGNTADQVDKLIRLSESQTDSRTRMVVWPETAVPIPVWEDQLLQNGYYQPIIAFVKRHPQVQLVTGIDSYRNFGNTSNGKFSMRHDEGSNIYYEAYNTALGLDTRLQPQLYHKSKLVPGVESLPGWLGFMGKIFEDFGGISGTLGRSDSVAVFAATVGPYRAAPVICYESVYGEYLTQYIRRGANIITIITNDGWWGNTPGYRQHRSYARLRAIETGCWIARSANTGISCFIDPNGKVYQPQPWDTEAAIKMNIPAGSAGSFYTRHGDYISRIAWMAALVLLVITVVAAFRRKNKNRHLHSAH